jgi:hypothetical protein
MKKENLGFIGVLLIIAIIFFSELYKKNDINQNEKSTTGKVKEFRKHYQARYSIVYEYSVKDITYTGHASVSSFKCDDGKKGCVGSEFMVYYSSKNPTNSRIDLGKYEKYR